MGKVGGREGQGGRGEGAGCEDRASTGHLHVLSTPENLFTCHGKLAEVYIPSTLPCIVAQCAAAVLVDTEVEDVLQLFLSVSPHLYALILRLGMQKQENS